MNYNEWKNGTYQGYEDPTYYNEQSRYCKICDIEEEKTYFIDDTCICEDCYDKPQITGIPNGNNISDTD
tara:strand:- start:20 stop:226 length:207 start_codon:yes stop_codon:yes gene_type:complete